MDRLVEVKINGPYLKTDTSFGGVQGEANITTLRIEFDEGWSGFVKTLYFLNAKGELPVKIDLTAAVSVGVRTYAVLIPGETLCEGGWFSFIVEGALDGVVQRSVEGKLYAEPVEDYEGAQYPEGGGSGGGGGGEASPKVSSIAVVETSNDVTFTTTFADGSTKVRVITKNAEGNPGGMTDDGEAVAVSWTEVEA